MSSLLSRQLPHLSFSLGAGLPRPIIKVLGWIRSPGCCRPIPTPCWGLRLVMLSVFGLASACNCKRYFYAKIFQLKAYDFFVVRVSYALWRRLFRHFSATGVTRELCPENVGNRSSCSPCQPCPGSVVVWQCRSV